MKRVCAWCSKELGVVESRQSPEELITHGICESCAESCFKELSEPLRKFLDRLKAPILLVGPEPYIHTANKAARDLLGKELSQIEGFKGGEVIDCALSFTQKGCGEDVHCESCTIRNTVMETFATERPFKEVPAFPDIKKLNEVKPYSIRISTEKVGNLVLLKIDQMKEEAQQSPGDNSQEATHQE